MTHPVHTVKSDRRRKRLDQTQDDRSVTGNLRQLAFCRFSPSFAHSANFGMTSMDSNCTMIEAVMYGMIPSAKIENWKSAPPENVFEKPKNICCRLFVASITSLD